MLIHKGIPVIISKTMQPKLQISIVQGFVYLYIFFNIY